MEANGLRCGVLFTADAYSRIVDEAEPSTASRFGDAATATLLTDAPKWLIGRCDYGSCGAKGAAIEVKLELGGRLHLDNLAVNKFVLDCVPLSIRRALSVNNLEMSQVDRIVVQQAGRRLVEDIGRKLGAPTKVGFYAAEYGDTGSSAIPLVVERNLDPLDRHVVASGFGAGLSWATTVLTKVD
jgi:3-oxoacyl-[acyl-carrier-protein] synthase-3